jgi:hypothetical protein
MGGSIEESALVCQERNGHSMLGGQGIAVEGAAQDDLGPSLNNRYGGRGCAGPV